jgi:hypothetical protein
MPALSDSPCVQLLGIPTVNVFLYAAAKNEFESSSAHIIGTIHLIIQGRQGLGTPLGILVTTSTYIAAGDSRPPLRYTIKLFEEAFWRDFLLLTLSKLA